MKRCSKCNVVKPLSDFYRQRDMRDGHRTECKACNLAAKKVRYELDPRPAIERTRIWQKENPERVNAWHRKHRTDPDVRRSERNGHLMRKFGITIEQYEQIFNLQGGVCAICDRPPTPGISLHVDHDHETGRIRGLVCFRCNNAMGDLNDDARLFGRVIEYLRPLRSGELHERVRALIRDRVERDTQQR